MKRTALYLSAALACLFSGQARAQSMDSVLVSVPESELPLLERNPRLDMLDLYNSKMEAKGENIFGGASYLTEKDDNYLRIRLTDVSEWELQRLTLDGDTLFVCIHSVSTPATGSTVRCYSKTWERDTSLRLRMPDFSDFWKPEADSLTAARRTSLRELLQESPVEIHWKHDAQHQPQLTFSLSVEGLSIEDRDDARRCLKPVTGPAAQFIVRTRP